MGDDDKQLSIVAATEQELSLASVSTNEFNKGNYEECILAINKLATSRPNDLKVLLNQAIVEYYKSLLTKTDEFRTVIKDICLKVNIEEQKGNMDDADECLIHYNHAILLYHTKQYGSSITALEKVIPFHDNLGETSARKFVFLLVELYLCTYQPLKALSLLDSVVKTSGQGNKQVDYSCENKPAKDKNVEIFSDKNHSVLVQFRLKCHLMLKSLSHFKNELKTLIAPPNTGIYILKAHCETLRYNFHGSVNLLNSLFSDENNRKSNLLMLSANNNLAVNYFNMRKYNLAHIYLGKAVEENSLLAKSINKKLDGKKGNQVGSGQPLNSITSNKQFELLHNMAITLLHSKKPQQAFDCLVQIIQVYKTNPRLWLRLAECCVMHNKECNMEEAGHDKKMSIVQNSVGSSIYKKIILGSGFNLANNKNISSVMPALTLEFASLCLENALVCLDYMCSIDNPQMNVADSTYSMPEDIMKQTQNNLSSGLSPSNPIKSMELDNLRCSILALKSYVALTMKNFLVALNSANLLLQQLKISGLHRYLGAMYRSEALVGLDKLAESIDQMNMFLLNDISMLSDTSKKDLNKQEEVDDNSIKQITNKFNSNLKWFPNNLDQAKNLLQYNLAVTFTIRGEFEKARCILESIIAKSNNILFAQMCILKIYIDLKDDRWQSAQIFLKEHYAQKL